MIDPRLSARHESDSLWRNPAYVRLFAAHAVTTAGSWITLAVMPLLVYQLTGSALHTALLTTVEFVPYPLFGLFAGAVADRLDRRRIMVAAELVSGIALASIPIASAFDALTLPHIYVAAVLAMTMYVWFDAANFGAVPALAGRERVVQAQSAIWSVATFTGIVAPALGGVLAATIARRTRSHWTPSATGPRRS
jgi:MFS family permease